MGIFSHPLCDWCPLWVYSLTPYAIGQVLATAEVNGQQVCAVRAMPKTGRTHQVRELAPSYLESTLPAVESTLPAVESTLPAVESTPK